MQQKIKNYCPNCQKLAYNPSGRCSKCGVGLIESPVRPMGAGGIVATIIVFIVIGVVVLTILGSSNDSVSNVATPNSASKTEEWYEGGTLHKAKISDWKIATEKNKLATCCDFILSVDSSIPMSEWKAKATSLKNCIDIATQDINIVDSESVSTIASACIIMGDYK